MRHATRIMLGALILVVAACAGGGDDDEIDPAGASRTNVGNQPSGDEVDEIEPIMADLLERHDEVVVEILEDPTVAEDDDSEPIQEYLALYSPDSEVPDRVIETWRRDAADGLTTRAAEVGYRAVESRIDGDIETVSDDEVRVPTCVVERLARYDTNRSPVEVVPYRETPGEVTVMRIDGTWLLQQIDTAVGQAECRVRETEESEES